MFLVFYSLLYVYDGKMTKGKYKKGIWQPEKDNPENLPVKEQLRRYQELCQLRREQQRIKEDVRELMAKYRSNAQKAGQLLE